MSANGVNKRETAFHSVAYVACQEFNNCGYNTSRCSLSRCFFIDLEQCNCNKLSVSSVLKRLG